MSLLRYTAEQIATLLSGKVEGNDSVSVHSFGKIESAQEGELTFLSNDKYESYIYTTRASIVLVADSFRAKQSISATLIRVADPYAALAQLMQLVAEQLSPRRTGVDTRAVIANGANIPEVCYIGAGSVIEEGVTLGKGCQIYPNVYIGKGCTIGENTIVYPNASIYYGCQVGKNCIIHSGAVIGADGFGFAPQLDGYRKIPQLGNVVIEDCVEIGANTCIDRAALGSTIIRYGAKLDNLIQIAHNCEVGAHSVLAAQVGMAGSSKIGSWCQIGGQVGIAGHLTIGDRVQIAGQTGILGNIKSDQTIMGSPAMDARQAMRVYASLRKLPDLTHRIETLEKELKSN